MKVTLNFLSQLNFAASSNITPEYTKSWAKKKASRPGGFTIMPHYCQNRAIFKKCDESVTRNSDHFMIALYIYHCSIKNQFV